MKIINSLGLLSSLMLLGCGGGSSSSSLTKTSFKDKTLYSFNLNFVDQRQRYDLSEVDGVDSSLQTKYFNFDSNTYEIDSKEQALFVDGKRRALADASYALTSSGSIEVTVNGQKMFRLTLLEANDIKSEKLSEYASNIAIDGKVYKSRLTYLANFYKVKDLVSDSAYTNLDEFVNEYKSKTFAGSVFSGLIFGENNNIRERVENNVRDAGTYSIKILDNKEILFLNPNNTKRYGESSCYILDFSRVWKAECHLKDSNETVNFYDQKVYNQVLKYMQNNFTEVKIEI